MFYQSTNQLQMSPKPRTNHLLIAQGRPRATTSSTRRGLTRWFPTVDGRNPANQLILRISHPYHPCNYGKFTHLPIHHQGLGQFWPFDMLNAGLWGLFNMQTLAFWGGIPLLNHHLRWPRLRSLYFAEIYTFTDIIIQSHLLVPSETLQHL